MNELLIFIKDYWTQILFVVGILVARCKDSKTISHWDLEAIQHSSELYFKLGGNSFVRDIVERTKGFKIKD